ncbi:hypothetical protein CCACVL1_25295 [Corchorus capsularis]|uniref:Uncharacterized protein n=1 Tax=Corchorus capsularis TaxID=210143 RepID=A0A1R3GL93_COCAP|nr:hypothetical protein CCACVL1_25295 [Corchorus capsularis]
MISLSTPATHPPPTTLPTPPPPQPPDPGGSPTTQKPQMDPPESQPTQSYKSKLLTFSNHTKKGTAYDGRGATLSS